MRDIVLGPSGSLALFLSLLSLPLSVAIPFYSLSFLLLSSSLSFVVLCVYHFLFPSSFSFFVLLSLSLPLSTYVSLCLHLYPRISATPQNLKTLAKLNRNA